MLVAPSDPDRSILISRVSRRGKGQMPPLATNVVDERAVKLMREWIAGLKPERPIVREWQMDDLLPDLAQVKAGRSAASGQAAFRETGCIQCHRFGTEGGSVGPDLSTVAKRLAPRDMLESILLPSKVITDEYAAYAIETTEGKVVSGRIERESDEVIVVQPASATEQPIEIKKADIVDRQRLDRSNMPTGTIDVLQKEQVLDLLAYLLGDGKPPAAASP
jgi:putative heme-binding domain-containing protein